MLFVSMFEILIDRNEHNDSGGYKGKYDVELIVSLYTSSM